MRKLWYYLSIPIFCLAFSINAFAYTATNITSTSTDADNDQISVSGRSFSSFDYTGISQADTNYILTYNIPQEYQIGSLRTGRYYNGFIRFQVAISTATSVQNGMPILTDNEILNGIYLYIRNVTSTTYEVGVFFDNWYCTGTQIGLPTIQQEFAITYDSEVQPLSFTQNFTFSLTIQASDSLRSTEDPLPTGLAGVIAGAVDDSTALAVIAGYLYDIKTQDYSYYTTLTGQIAQIITLQGTTNTRLQNILNEIDLDFQQVQAILDLFPSYRTQVLEYWQRFLEMNAAESSAAAEQESEYADRDNQSQQLISGMGSVTMPSLGASDFNIIGNVDATQKANFFGLIGLITHTEIVTKIMLIIVLGAIVGWVLYGKK